MTAPESQPELEASDLGRFEPTLYDLGISDNPDASWPDPQAEPEPDAEPEPLPDPDPEVGSWPGWSDRSMLAPEPELDAEAEAEAEAEWADNWDSADSHAYMDRVEAGLEPEAEP